jgi:hypothetical protein
MKITRLVLPVLLLAAAAQASVRRAVPTVPGNLTPAERFAFARQVTGIKRLSRAQKEAILTAHEIGLHQMGYDGKPVHMWYEGGKLRSNFTKQQLRAREDRLMRIVKNRPTFTKRQTTDLIRSGTTGWLDALQTAAKVLDTVGADVRLIDGADRGDPLATGADIASALGANSLGMGVRAVEDAAEGHEGKAALEGLAAYGMRKR